MPQRNSKKEKVSFSKIPLDDIAKFVKRQLSRDSTLTQNEMAEMVIEHFNAKGAIKYVKEVIRRAKASDAHQTKKKVSEEIKIAAAEPAYTVVSNQYIFKTIHGIMKFDVSMIDELFYEYSKHGLDLSQTQIMIKYDLKPEQWAAIKRRLMLFKQSHVFSPHTVEITPKDKLDEMIENKLDKVFSSVGHKVEHQFEKRQTAEAKKTIFADTERRMIVETMMLELCEQLPSIKIDKLKYDGVETLGIKELNVFVFDPHFGADNFNISTPGYVRKYNIATTIAHFARIARIVNTYKAEKVNVFFGGDNIHSYTGMNHPGTWKGMTPGLFGANLLIEAYKVFGSFLSSINNLNIVYGVEGNHDRSTAKWFEDNTITKLLFEFLGFVVPDAKFIYDQKLISVPIDGIQYIMGHGHLKLLKKSADRIVLEHGDQTKFNLIMTGHFHTRMMISDTPNLRQEVCPPVFVADEYARDGGWSPSPGFKIAYNDYDSNGVPTVVDHPL